jgi:hypothetical protein
MTILPIARPPRPVALTGYPRYARRQHGSGSTKTSVAQNFGANAMTTFDKREEGFEQQFAHDEELRFKATARRNKLLGLWVAEKLGMSGAEADSYAKSVVMSDIEDVSSHDVLGKVRKDLEAKGVAQSDHQLSRIMTELMEKAVADIKAGR